METSSLGVACSMTLMIRITDGPVFVRIAAEDAFFRQVCAIDGTLVWPGDVDIAPVDPR